MVGGPRQRFFLKKIKFLCRGPAWKPSAKIFKKKRIILCRGPSHCPRQRFFGKILHISLPRAMVGGPRQRFFKKKIILCRGPPETALGKDSVPGADAMTAAFLCRVPVQPSAKTLFADSKFSESSLPRAALGKAFAER